MKENRQNNNFNYNDWAKDNNQWHFHIGKTGLIIICIVAFIAIFGSGVFDTDEPSETTDSTQKQTIVQNTTDPVYKNPIKSISLGYSVDDTIELDSGDYDYVYFKFNTSNYQFDDIELVNSNPDVCRFEIYDNYPSATLNFKIYSLSEGEAVIYIQTSDGSVKSPEIKITVNPNPETTTKPVPQENVSYKIVSTKYNVGVNSIGTVWMECIITVENTGNTNLYLKSCKFDVEDSSGSLIASKSYIDAYPRVIAPGERAVYYHDFSLDDGNIFEEYVIIPKISVEKAVVPIERLAVSDLKIKESEYGGYLKALGRVENTTSEEQTLYYVVIFLYDSNHELIGLMYGLPDTLAPGEKTGFEITSLGSYKDLSLSDIYEYEAIAYPYQHQY